MIKITFRSTQNDKQFCFRGFFVLSRVTGSVWFGNLLGGVLSNKDFGLFQLKCAVQNRLSYGIIVFLVNLKLIKKKRFEIS